MTAAELIEALSAEFDRGTKTLASIGADVRIQNAVAGVYVRARIDGRPGADLYAPNWIIEGIESPAFLACLIVRRVYDDLRKKLAEIDMGASL